MRPLYECKGEKFQKIQIFKDRIRLMKGKKTVELPMDEVCCLTHQLCQDTKCHLYIPSESLNNCILNINRSYQCHEIGDITGITRQAVSHSEMRGRKSFISKAKRLRLPQNLPDWTIDRPEVVIRNGLLGKKMR